MRLTINNLSYSYKDTIALSNVSFTLSNGDFMVIVGPNGSGKSTLLKCLDRILKYKQGLIQLDGEDIKQISPRTLSRKMAYVPQKDEYTMPNSVFDTVMLGRKPYIEWGITAQDIQIVTELLQRFDLSSLAMRDINTLSGGQKQRVYLARALAQQPDILLLDEPTANLDLFHQSEILENLATLANEGLIIIVTMHDINLALQYCNKAIMLSNGSLFASGGKEIFTKDNIDDLFGTTVKIVSQDNQTYILPQRKNNIRS